MASHFVEESLLPGVMERRKILEQAGIVLAEARSLLSCLDQTGGRLNPDAIEPLRRGSLTALTFEAPQVVETRSTKLRGLASWRFPRFL